MAAGALREASATATVTVQPHPYLCELHSVDQCWERRSSWKQVSSSPQASEPRLDPESDLRPLLHHWHAKFILPCSTTRSSRRSSASDRRPAAIPLVDDMTFAYEMGVSWGRWSQRRGTYGCCRNLNRWQAVGTRVGRCGDGVQLARARARILVPLPRL